jgi:hypothetical protein
MNIVRNKEPQMTEFTSWEDMTELEQAQATYWDMHKDAYGFRPRGVDTSSWTLEQFQEEFVILGQAIDREETARKASESKAVELFERRVAELISTGAKDSEMAMRWIHEAEETNGDNDYLAWTLGLPYQYFRKAA